MRITFGGPRCYWTTLASDLRAWRKWRCRRGNGSSSVTSSSVNPEKNSVPSRSNYGDMCHFREFKIQLLSSEIGVAEQACSAGGGPPILTQNPILELHSASHISLCQQGDSAGDRNAASPRKFESSILHPDASSCLIWLSFF